ncbi:MAG: hypothetical protein J6I50_01400 [Clostridia bacterium]|nr:hypothetical protein [Clostridia bacterium]
MRKLTKVQLVKMDAWMQEHARLYDRAKWNYLFHDGEKDAIVKELISYQNPDGGIGHGFESDIQSPLSAAIPSAEAIFQAYEYDLDCSAAWFQNILSYFEHSVQDIPKYWEDCPKEAMDSPHAPWWHADPGTRFTPNPCACAASALIRYGTEQQRALGNKVAQDCLSLLVGSGDCGDHDTLNLQVLVEQLLAIHSDLITEEVVAALRRRIYENTCFDVSRYEEYCFTPLDFVSSPDSLWYDVVKQGIEQNFEYWFDTINADGVWNPNFTWGVDSAVARQVTQNWIGYITVKRAKILLQFDRIEK